MGFKPKLLEEKLKITFTIICKQRYFDFKQIPTEIGWKMLSNDSPTPPNLFPNQFIDFLA